MPRTSRPRTARSKEGHDWTGDLRFATFIDLFDRRRYFQAHEVLEELWLEVRGTDRPFLQGLIQLAVALEHHARKNPAGARKVLQSAKRRLAPFGDRHRGVPVGALQTHVASYLGGRATAPPRFPIIRATPRGRSQPRSGPVAERGGTAAPPGSASRSETRSASTSATSPPGPAVRGSRMENAKPGGSGMNVAVKKATSAPKPGALMGTARSARVTEKRGPVSPQGRPRDAAIASPAVTGARTRAGQVGKVDPARPGARSGPPSGRRAATSAVRKTALDPIEARRARASAIAAGLRRMYPGARCELRHASALELLVATILSAQCTDARVNMTTPALFARYRTAADYANADPAELISIIKSTGFFNNKARSIIALGKALEERYGGNVPEAMEDLVTLPGVGRKTANVLISDWFGRPGIAVDTHVIRLTGPVWRLTDETDPVKIEFALYDLIPEAERSFFGIATIFHGRQVCYARNPDCPGCLLNTICPSAFTFGRAPAASTKGVQS